VAQVVGADLALEPVRCPRVRHRHDACVVDQHVGRVDAGGELADRRKVLQVQLAHLDLAGHLRRGGVAFLGVADGEDDVSADPRQLTRGDLAETAVGAGHDHGAAGERGQLCGSPFSHARHPSAAAGAATSVRR
jgi:hypothetical protein